jgi:putative transposase
MLGDGKDATYVRRDLQISEQTYCRCRNQFGGLKPDHARRLKVLERRTPSLRRLLADADLEKAALNQIARGHLPLRGPYAACAPCFVLAVARQTLGVSTAWPWC